MPLEITFEDTKNNLWLIKHNGFTVGTIVQVLDAYLLEMMVRYKKECPTLEGAEGYAYGLAEMMNPVPIPGVNAVIAGADSRGQAGVLRSGHMETVPAPRKN